MHISDFCGFVARIVTYCHEFRPFSKPLAWRKPATHSSDIFSFFIYISKRDLQICLLQIHSSSSMHHKLTASGPSSSIFFWGGGVTSKLGQMQRVASQVCNLTLLQFCASRSLGELLHTIFPPTSPLPCTTHKPCHCPWQSCSREAVLPVWWLSLSRHTAMAFFVRVSWVPRQQLH